jgi:hypothetical protein
MPPPQDFLRTFVAADKRPGFPFRGWQNVVGDKRCFHLPGFTEVCEQLGIDNRAGFFGPESTIPMAALLKRARDRVPPEWKAALGKGNKRRGKEWDELGEQQITSCYKREPLLLQKALMTLIFLEELVVYVEGEWRKEHGVAMLVPGFDVYTEIRIDPAVFYVKGFDPKYYTQYLHSRSTQGKVLDSARNEALRRLKEAGQEAPVFDDITANNRTCLYTTAIGVIQALKHENFIGDQAECKVVTAREKRTSSKLERAQFRGKIPLRAVHG